MTPEAGFAEAVRRGLTASPKWLDPKYFYDELGSLLFAAICALPEYYLTRAETAILAAHAGDMIAGVPAPLSLVELGSGDALKTRYLIEAALARQVELDYTPIDISRSALVASSRRLVGAYPNLTVRPRVGDYRRELAALVGEGSRSRRTLALFLGSSLGNFHPAEAREFLAGVRQCLGAGDALLLGLDLEKSERILIPAYDDPLGVTAAFNRNHLVRINRELEGRFDVRRFAHRVRYDEGRSRMEMYLVSEVDQSVPIGALDLEVPFAAGEAILSECSYKYRRDRVASLAAAAGFGVAGTWTDADGYFLSSLLTVGPF